MYHLLSHLDSLQGIQVGNQQDNQQGDQCSTRLVSQQGSHLVNQPASHPGTQQDNQQGYRYNIRLVSQQGNRRDSPLEHPFKYRRRLRPKQCARMDTGIIVGTGRVASRISPTL